MEKKVNIRWLTHESDEERWEEYRIKNKLPENDFGPIITRPKYQDDDDTPNEEENVDKFITNNDSFRRRNFDPPTLKTENGNGHSNFHSIHLYKNTSRL